jgi:hypothetical protein
VKLKSPELVWVQVQDEVVILDTRSSSYSSLNRTAAKLWVALSAGTSVTEMEALLQKEYAIDAETAKRDVAHFVDALREQDMLDEQED